MTDPHLDIALSESAAANVSTPWDQWIARLTKLLEPHIGRDHDGKPSLDGDEAVDGYSLDTCHDLYRAGKTPLQASATVLWRMHGLHRDPTTSPR